MGVLEDKLKHSVDITGLEDVDINGDRVPNTGLVTQSIPCLIIPTKRRVIPSGRTEEIQVDVDVYFKPSVLIDLGIVTGFVLTNGVDLTGTTLINTVLVVGVDPYPDPNTAKGLKVIRVLGKNLP